MKPLISLRRPFALLLLALALAAPASARPHATPTPAPTPTPVADPAITKIAWQQFVAWQAGSINRSLYSPEVQPKLLQAQIDEVSHALGTLGPLTGSVFIGPFTASDIPTEAHGYIYQMNCARGNVYLSMIIDANGKIATIYFNDKLNTETIVVPGGAPVPSPLPT